MNIFNHPKEDSASCSMWKYFLFIVALFTVLSSRAADTLELADPTIMLDGDTYYLYGTSSNRGFLCYSSTDLEHWHGPVGVYDGFCLRKGDAWGSSGFWAPQVMKVGDIYYMFYVANEQLGVATSPSPCGPFVNYSFAMLPAKQKEIDPFVFRDDDGKWYIYHDRLIKGNHIFVAGLNSDFQSMREGTVRLCVSAETTQGWENTSKVSWPICEGPTVVKVDKKYYLFYSCNDYRSPDYAVGVATADNPYGPWSKDKHNPLISRCDIGINGTGHGDLFRDKNGQWRYVFHTHHDNSTVSPRRTAIVTLKYSDGCFQLVRDSFRYLTLDEE